MASCKSALTSPPHPLQPAPTVVYSTDRSKAVVPVLVLLFGALWFILRGDLLYVLPCAILFLCFTVPLALRLPRLGKRELTLVLFVCLIDLCSFGFVGFLFLLMSGKCCVSLKTLLQQGISEPEFYDDLVYRFRKVVGKSNFSEKFRQLTSRYKRIGYSLDIMRQTACLVVNQILVDGYASL